MMSDYRVEHICPNCGTICYVNKYKIGKTKSGLNFCSTKCNTQYHGKERTENSGKIEIVCDFCNNRIMKPASKVRDCKNNYCSRKCSDQHKKETMKGSGNHRYGIKASEETQRKKSDCMKEMWEKSEYREKVLFARNTSRSLIPIPPGWSLDSQGKRRKTYFQNYGTFHNWASVECREKCEITTIAKYGKGSLDLARDKITEETYEKRRITLIETMTGVSYEEWQDKLSEREKYYKKVRYLTEKQPLYLLENFEKRSRHSKNQDPFHLDHIIPICYGWLNNIPPQVIADLSNLRFIPASENIAKSSYHEGTKWRTNAEDDKD
jgi:hypothetical protein